jgi:transforming growth factor-beta-induced protein
MNNTAYSITGFAPEQFSTLKALIDQVGLAETLSGYGADSTGFTVFAPINVAFTGVDATALTDEQITEILLYHVVPEPYTAATLVSGPLTTVGGATVMIDVSASGIKVNDAMVVFPDILASNGVVHVIAGLLMPPADMTPTATPPPATPTATAPGAAPPSSARNSTAVSVLFAAALVLSWTVAWM